MTSTISISQRANSVFANLFLAVMVGLGMLGIFNPQQSKAAPPSAASAGMQDAIDTVKNLDTVATAALAVCLVPMALMMTLRFLKMVLDRV